METPPNLPPVFKAFEQQQLQKKKSRNIIKWIIGLLLILAGIGLTTDGNSFSGICLLLAGLLLLPSVLSLIEQTLKLSIRPIILYPVIVVLFLIGAINHKDLTATDTKIKTDESNSTSEPPANNPYSDYEAYLNNSKNSIAQLNDTQKAARQKALAELKNDITYIKLVNKQVLNEKYLVVLQTIGEGIISLKTSDNTFSIPVSTESELKEIPGALRFVIRTIGLEALGGVSKDILAVYSRYFSNYRIAGNKGTVIYHTEPNFSETINKDYTLAPALVIFQPNNHNFLDAYYAAIQVGLIHWQSDNNSDYKYPYLRSKTAFNDYLKSNYSESKYFVNYDLETTASNLWAEYDANEVSADEKYKNKVVAINGTVESIRKDFLDKPYIVLSAGGYLEEIQCSFKNGSELKKLSKGDNLTIIGTCTGRVLTAVSISDCRIF